MADLQRTTAGPDGHYHIIYIDDYGNIFSSPDDKDSHSHGISFIENPQTGEMQYVVEEADGHSHDIIDIILEEEKEKTVKGKEDTILSDAMALAKEAVNLESSFRVRGRKCYDFYKGDQWASEDVSKLKDSSRAAITVNEIRPLMQVLSGHQRQNRTDLKTFPIEKADPRGAELSDILLKYVFEKENFAQNESNAFLDCIIVGRGLLDAYVDFSFNIEGDIKIVRFKWDNIYFGPHEYEDLSDLEYLVKSKWFSLEKMKSIYKDKKDQISVTYNNILDENLPYTNNEPGKEYTVTLPDAYEFSGETAIDLAKKNVRLFELWKKRYYHVSVLVNVSKDTTFVYEKSKYLSSKDFRLALKIPGMEKRDVSEWNMEVITFIPGVLLEKRVSSLKDFNVCPIYASKEDGYVQGKVEQCIGLQEEINKRTSQAIDVVNRANNDIYYIDSTTFANPAEEQSFRENANTPGFVSKLLDVNKKRPVKEERGRYPSELINMRELASAKLKEITGVTAEVLGQESNAKSGVAIARRLRQGLTVNDYLFDNLSIAKKRLGKIVLRMIQNVYSVDRIMKILHQQNEIDPFQLTNAEGQKQNFNEIDKEFVKQFLNNVDFTEYDIAISESANSPTKNLDRFTALSELMSNGSLNPITLKLAKDAGLISPSDAAEVEAMLFQQQQTAMNEKQLDNKNQLDRTLIAQGIDPETKQPLQGAQNRPQ